MARELGNLPTLVALPYVAQYAPTTQWREAARTMELCLCFRIERGVQMGIVIPFDRHDADHAASLADGGQD